MYLCTIHHVRASVVMIRQKFGRHLTVTITFAPFEIIYKKYQAAVQIETGQIQ